DNQFPAVAMIDSAANQFRVSQRPTAATMAYQLVITIEEVTPRIWRRLMVTSDTTLTQLHTYLQIAFGWEDYHLHEFRLHGEECDEAMTLGQLGVRHGDLFDYVYDFGDYWLHAIAIEDCTPMNPRARYPRCTGGAQPGPEEDSGGAYAYSQKLARSRRAKAAAKKRTNNAGGTSKPKKKRATSQRTFSQATVNRRLAAFCAGDPFYASA
ncbi:plasmid pRiA4b ORF-3 family protein, partial [Herpetosiphon giganteus]|uniref:plasmid pRiA4b ORF-3 family protein n=1 Tax=Herpetosiphon giganteus TaxID=2029754 RepID=UPI00195C7631